MNMSVCLNVCACKHVFRYVCVYVGFNFPDFQCLIGASKTVILEFHVLIIKLAKGVETVFSWPCGTPLLITHFFLGKVDHDILKHINNFGWRLEMCPLNHFSCTKFNHLRELDFHVTSMNMKFRIPSRHLPAQS